MELRTVRAVLVTTVPADVTDEDLKRWMVGLTEMRDYPRKASGRIMRTLAEGDDRVYLAKEAVRDYCRAKGVDVNNLSMGKICEIVADALLPIGPDHGAV